jgi:AcrR family transcriptional regulator
LQIEVSAVNMFVMRASDPSNRDHYHHGDLRNALIQTGLRLVARKGPEAFSLREAAREVGVSAAAAYRHFADKQELLKTLAEDGHARLALAMEKALETLSSRRGTKGHAIAALEALGASYVDFAVSHPSHFRVMFGLCTQQEGFEPGVGPSGRDAFQILIDLLDELVAVGVITASARQGAEITAWSSVHGLSGLLVDGVLELNPQERAESVHALVRTLLVGLGCEPGLVRPAAPVSVDPRAQREAKFGKKAKAR